MAEIVDHPLSNVSEDRIVEIRDKLMIDLNPINLGKEQMTTAARMTDNVTDSLVQPLFEGPVDVVGDIHGEFDALRSLMHHLG